LFSANIQAFVKRFQPFPLTSFNGIDKNLFNRYVEMKNIYLKAMESFLFYQHKPWKR